MIWLKFVKKYLAGLAAKDFDLIEEMMDDDIEILSFHGRSMKGKKEVVAHQKLFLEDVVLSIHILNTAYHDRYVVVEAISATKKNGQTRRENVIFIVEIGNSGKIVQIREYHRI